LANLSSELDKGPRIIDLALFRSESDSHGSGNSDGRCTANRHRSYGIRYGRGITAIQIKNFLRKSPLIKDPDPIPFPFNGFKFHSSQFSQIVVARKKPMAIPEIASSLLSTQ
jgi:hypothetical protein